ncbi:MAG: low molecular weight phosphatase family protein [Pseudomonadota bacterium]
MPYPLSHNEQPSSVLFACNMNAVRSPMAAGLLRHLVGRRIYVRSAGVRVGTIDHFAIEAMNEIGVDISGHRPKTLFDLQDAAFDAIISLTPEAHHQALEFTRTMSVDVSYWPTLDPTLHIGNGSRDQILTGYRSCRDFLFNSILKRFRLTAPPVV